jgi:hypothetical protein
MKNISGKQEKLKEISIDIEFEKIVYEAKAIEKEALAPPTDMIDNIENEELDEIEEQLKQDNELEIPTYLELLEKINKIQNNKWQNKNVDNKVKLSIPFSKNVKTNNSKNELIKQFIEEQKKQKEENEPPKEDINIPINLIELEKKEQEVQIKTEKEGPIKKEQINLETKKEKEEKLKESSEDKTKKRIESLLEKLKEKKAKISTQPSEQIKTKDNQIDNGYYKDNLQKENENYKEQSNITKEESLAESDPFSKLSKQLERLKKIKEETITKEEKKPPINILQTNQTNKKTLDINKTKNEEIKRRRKEQKIENEDKKIDAQKEKNEKNEKEINIPIIRPIIKPKFKNQLTDEFTNSNEFKNEITQKTQEKKQDLKTQQTEEISQVNLDVREEKIEQEDQKIVNKKLAKKLGLNDITAFENKTEDIEKTKDTDKEFKKIKTKEKNLSEEAKKLLGDSEDEKTQKDNKFSQEKELPREVYVAYAKENIRWLYEIYKIGGMTFDEFKEKVKEKMQNNNLDQNEMENNYKNEKNDNIEESKNSKNKKFKK